ncbi:PleD family two-component system response regulator [Chloroflexota bacterium]
MVDRILIVDDTPEARVLLRILLTSKADFIVLEAANGVEALQQAQANPPPDLIILDYMMPDLDGPELLTQMRQIPALANIPVIILTARTDPKAREQSMKAGANRFIIKPIKPLDLLTEVQTLLAQHKTTATGQG